ncbi:hypothetical protein ACFFLS_10095 [Flavobacterium procerum]|uniref:Uncharacterized protein n=1 Tax=Flavobacterium procerum TaxID=1455569 RepID=A0ABV6BPK8_9FLAO
MKILVLFFCICSIANAQNKNQKSQFVEKEIQSCRIPIDDSVSLFKIHENLHGNDIAIIIKTENTTTNECSNTTISKNLLAKVKTAQNPLIDINKHPIGGIDLKDFPSLIPNKIASTKKATYTVLAIELYNFSYTTVGSGYIYLCFKIDTKGEIIKQKTLESKSPIKTAKLLSTL